MLSTDLGTDVPGSSRRPGSRRRRYAVRLGAVLLASALATTACSSGSPTAPKTTGKKTTATPTFNYKLKQESGQADVKNVVLKVGGGDKVSLSSPAPGHDIIAQHYSAKAAAAQKKKGKKGKKLGWSKPTTVYSSNSSYCSKIDAATYGGTVAAVVTCSTSKTERTASTASVLLVTDDLSTWKNNPLPGAHGVPTVSPSGKYASFNSPAGFEIWGSTTGFSELKVAQTPAHPAVGAIMDDGKLILVRSKYPKSCVVWLLTATPSAPTPHGVFTSKAIPGQPNCTPLDAKMTKTDLKVDMQSVTTTGKKKHLKTKKKKFTAYFKQGTSGGWSIE